MPDPNVFFVADTHFCHSRVVEMNARPFADVGEMDARLVDAWNARVGPDDVVWHLGDFACTTRHEKVASVFHRLNGVKHLVVGNHDVENEATLDLPWASLSETKAVEIAGTEVFLCHYPMRTWPGARKGGIHLYGHMHGRLRGNDRSLDVGVDVWGFRPVTLPEVRKRLSTLPPDPDFEGKGPRAARR